MTIYLDASLGRVDGLLRGDLIVPLRAKSQQEGSHAFDAIFQTAVQPTLRGRRRPAAELGRGSESSLVVDGSICAGGTSWGPELIKLLLYKFSDNQSSRITSAMISYPMSSARLDAAFLPPVISTTHSLVYRELPMSLGSSFPSWP